MIKVETAARFMNRQSSFIGKSVYKSLTELITNSDDSYARLVDRGERPPDELQEIWVVYDEATDEFRVIDHAEGMTKADMERKLGEYGSDTSGSSEGAPVRGLFGQGLSDVLFYHDHSQIQSIVDRTLYRCPFIKKEEKWFIDPKATRARVDRKLREALSIPSGNGTVVSFILAENVKKPVQRFVQKLERFYMLRLILSSENKRVYYIERRSNGKTKTHELRYEFPDGEVLVNEKEVTFSFESYSPVTAQITLKRAKGEIDSEDTGLLVFDEKRAVYDKTFFGYPDDYPGTERLFGTVRLVGARDIILAKMNQQRPEEILTSSRNGFDKSQPFYQALEHVVRPIIEPFIREGQAQRARDNDLSQQQQENQRKALDLFDQLYKDVMEDTTFIADPHPTQVPPAGGLEFDRREIKATEQKNYGLGLNLNTSILPVGTMIRLSSDNPSVVVLPEEFEIKEEMIVVDNLARRYVTIRGTEPGEVGLVTAGGVEAKGDTDVEASVVVTIVKEALCYPETMAFFPAAATVKEDGAGKGALFVNTTAVPIGSTISLSAESHDTDLVLAHDQLTLEEGDVAYDDIARVNVEFLVGKKGGGEIVATAGSQGCALSVRVVEPKVNEPTGPQSKFRDWQFANTKWQCLYDAQSKSPTSGWLLVSDSHPLNRMYFGNEPSKESVNESLAASVYLAELLLNEALDYMFDQKSKQERKAGGSVLAEQDPHLYIKRFLQEKKAEIGPTFHRLFIDEKLMRRHEQETAKRLEEVAH